MSREHTPRPGVNWGRERVSVEVAVDDEAWTVTPWLEPAPARPFEQPEPANREQRRAMKRDQRRKGSKR